MAVMLGASLHGGDAHAQQPTGTADRAAASSLRSAADKTASVSNAEVNGTTDLSTVANRRVLSFEQLGQRRPIRLRGVTGEIAIPIAVRDDEVVTRPRPFR